MIDSAKSMMRQGYLQSRGETTESKPKLVRSRTIRQFKLPLLLILVHIPLGLMLFRWSALTFVHPAAVFLLGIYIAARKDFKLERVAYVVAYIVGVEVLWRMTKSPVFWEFGKYGAATIMIVALVRRQQWRTPRAPLLYFVLLLPACLMTAFNNDLGTARDQLSGNMSGPFLLFVSCWFFSYLKIGETEIKHLLLSITVPLVSIAVATAFLTVSAEEISFNTESNYATSGGFGPNQVSTMFGLGVFVCLSLYLLFENSFRVKVSLGVLIIAFSVQSVMTFSRGGMYTALGAALVIIFFQARSLRQVFSNIFPVLGVVTIFVFLVFPYLDDFTGGKLQERFEQTNTTNRAVIVEADMQIFLQNPIFGVGVGDAKTIRRDYLGYRSASHTEFARLLAEHGAFGLLALLVLSIGAFLNFKHKSTLGRGLAGGVLVWSALYMLNAGMRLAAPSVLWGLAYITICMPRLPLRVRKVGNLKPLSIAKLKVPNINSRLANVGHK